MRYPSIKWWISWDPVQIYITTNGKQSSYVRICAYSKQALHEYHMTIS